MSFKGRLRQLDDKLERVKAIRGQTKEWPTDPVDFCIQHLGFKPTVYQEKLLHDPAQFIAARWSRQSGKTHCVAVLLLWSCLRNRFFNVLVLAPSVRQSKIIIRKISGFLTKLPKYVAMKQLKTKIEFYNGSRIQAFPNSPETIRGEPGVNFLYCLPYWTLISRPDGRHTPIGRLKPGELVVTLNRFTRVLETKRILKVLRNPLAGREIVRIKHDNGCLESTADHRIFTDNRGYVPARSLTTKDQLLTCWKIQASTFENLHPNAGASHSWRSPRRLLSGEKKQFRERLSCRESFVQASRVRSVQVLDSEGFRRDPAADYKELGVGNMECWISNSQPSEAHRNLRIRISGWQEDNHYRVVGQDYFPSSTRDLVHGRRFERQVQLDDFYALLHPYGLSTSPGMALIEVGCSCFHRRGQEGDRLLLEAQGGRAREALWAHQTPYYTEHVVQGADPADTKSRANPVQTSPQIGTPVRDLYSTIRNRKTEPDHMQSDLWPREKAQDSPSIQNPIQPQEKISANNFAGGEGHRTEGLHVLWRNVSTTEQSSKNLQRDMLQETGPNEQREIRREKADGTFVYDLEVEDNHNFFANGVLVSNCDEFAYIKNDKELYEAAVFSLVTTNGRFLATSTPGSRESLFYSMCTDDNNYAEFSRHHVSYLDALEPNGPLKHEILEKLKRQFAADPWRWRREMEAEFADDEDAWFSMSLITRCLDAKLE